MKGMTMEFLVKLGLSFVSMSGCFVWMAASDFEEWSGSRMVGKLAACLIWSTAVGMAFDIGKKWAKLPEKT